MISEMRASDERGMVGDEVSLGLLGVASRNGIRVSSGTVSGESLIRGGGIERGELEMWEWVVIGKLSRLLRGGLSRDGQELVILILFVVKIP